MLFNSYPFLLVFLPLTIAGFFLLGSWNRRLAASGLMLASVVFYAWWDYRFVPLIVASVTWNYTGGILILRLPRFRRTILTIAIAGDLVLLGYFKYAGFFLGVGDHTLGTTYGPFNVVIPLGISFFTFTQIAFLIDTARGKVREYDFTHYALFVTYFPHLIAGPILHHKEIMPQFSRPTTYRPQADHIAIGIAFFSIGLFKKCVVADSLIFDVQSAFNAAAHNGVLSAPIAWKGALAYTLQLYFDFSGYADMAIGLSRLFNVRLPINFNSPYKSQNIIEFWRRWHMTLSRFLRDYLYFSLGGNRKGWVRRYVNVLVVMVLGGLWHGAGWTFIVWGGLHGIYIIVNRGWLAIKPGPVIERVPPRWRNAIALSITFVAVVIAWVFFRAADLPSALRMLAAMTGAYGFAMPPAPVAYGDLDLFMLGLGVPGFAVMLSSVLFYAGALFAVFAMPNTQELLEPERYRPSADRPWRSIPIRWSPSPAWAVLCAVFMGLSVMTFSHVTEFLYFQF